MARTASFAYAIALAFAGQAHGQIDEQVAARLTPTVHICEKSSENSGTLQQALCYKEEAARQDQHLNKTWVEVIKRLSPVRRDALRRSERHWLKKRDADCRDETSDYINSTAAYMFNVCMVNENIRRTMWLEKAQ